MNNEYVKFKLLSIDAWKDFDGVWNWNNWHELEDGIYFHESRITPRCILSALRKWGYLNENSKGKLSIDDDGYNIVVQQKDTYEPIFALQYGE